MMMPSHAFNDQEFGPFSKSLSSHISGIEFMGERGTPLRVAVTLNTLDAGVFAEVAEACAEAGYSVESIKYWTAV